MKKTVNIAFAAGILLGLLLAACGGGGGQATQAPGGAALERSEPPAEYAGKTNPHAGDSAAAADGKTVYNSNCASCHGETAMGDGPAAASLNPKPQDLKDNQSGLSDAYMLWRISEGGAMAPFNSAMPAWKGILTEDQIWQVVTYIRSLGG
jgi:mono/diheme cytochrome c family protein